MLHHQDDKNRVGGHNLLGCVTNLDNKRLKNWFCVEGVVKYIFHGTFFADYFNKKFKK